LDPYWLWESFAAYPNLDAVILLTRDQPLVDREIIIGLNTKREEAKKPIIASRCASTLGIPALFDRAYFDELFVLDNEAGAKSVILNQSTDLAEYSFIDGAIDIEPPLSAQLCKPVSLRAGERMPDFTTRRSRATTFRKSASLRTVQVLINSRNGAKT